MNPLDFSYWGRAQAYVYEKKPTNLSELKAAVEDFNASLTETDIRKMCGNMLKRAWFCLMAEGGHFEHLLKQGKKQQ